LSYLLSQSLELAIADFTQFIKLNPTMAQVYVNRGWLYHQIGRNRQAIADLRLACQKFKQQGNMTAYRQTIALINKLQSNVAIG
jgi:regulator of sirC expression with transglutaminase-like and TPR domain